MEDDVELEAVDEELDLVTISSVKEAVAAEAEHFFMCRSLYCLLLFPLPLK